MPPSTGPVPTPAAVFRLFAPEVESVVWVSPDHEEALPMAREADKLHWGVEVPGFTAGGRYAFRIDGKGPFPDPRSRFQPEGVHGWSRTVDFSAFSWKHRPPDPPEPARRVLYEIHVGTFTPEGTYSALRDRLPHLRGLGVTHLELMPLSDFPGRWNWGYDGVSPYAPARCYGTPEELAALVDAAHGQGLGVLLDVVFNHLGPDGNYLGLTFPNLYNPVHRTPWGAGLHFDGPWGPELRRHFIEAAVQWVRDYRFDGLRLDATHEISEAGEPPFLAELTSAVRGSADRPVLLYAEDHRNDPRLCRAVSTGGLGCDGVWVDDWHHHMRRKAAGDADGYFAPFAGSAADLAFTARRGWFRDGSFGEGYLRTGGDPEPLGYESFVFYLQNHDQIGNRAYGDRLGTALEPAVWRAWTAFLLLCPETPLLFMGQEWEAATPFQFFTDHGPDLGRKVTQGRRREFSGFAAFRDPALRALIPDPQDPDTRHRSCLDWSEPDREKGRRALAWVRALLTLRANHPALGSAARADFDCEPWGEAGWQLRRRGGGKVLEARILVGDGLPHGDGRPEHAQAKRLLDSRWPDFAEPGQRANAFAVIGEIPNNL